MRARAFARCVGAWPLLHICTHKREIPGYAHAIVHACAFAFRCMRIFSCTYMCMTICIDVCVRGVYAHV